MATGNRTLANRSCAQVKFVTEHRKPTGSWVERSAYLQMPGSINGEGEEFVTGHGEIAYVEVVLCVHRDGHVDVELDDLQKTTLQLIPAS